MVNAVVFFNARSATLSSGTQLRKASSQVLWPHSVALRVLHPSKTASVGNLAKKSQTPV